MKFMYDLRSTCRENNKTHFGIVTVTWCREGQNGGDKTCSDSRWILKIETLELTQIFFN